MCNLNPSLLSGLVVRFKVIQSTIHRQVEDTGKAKYTILDQVRLIQKKSRSQARLFSETAVKNNSLFLVLYMPYRQEMKDMKESIELRGNCRLIPFLELSVIDVTGSLLYFFLYSLLLCLSCSYRLAVGFLITPKICGLND